MKEWWAMMNKTMSGAAMLALWMTVGASEVAGQLGPRPDRSARAEVRAGRMAGPVARRTPGLEGILRMRERLELTEEQVTRLDALRGEQVTRRSQAEAELSEVRSRLLAGTLGRTEARERISALRETRRADAEASRAAVAEVLDDAQEAELEQLQARRRAFEAGRRSVLRDQRRGPVRPGRPGPMRGRAGMRGGR